MAKNRIQVSFKQNERDLKLYNYVMSQNDKSCFIKNAIEYYLKCRFLGREFKDNLHTEDIDI